MATAARRSEGFHNNYYTILYRRAQIQSGMSQGMFNSLPSQTRKLFLKSVVDQWRMSRLRAVSPRFSVFFSSCFFPEQPSIETSTVVLLPLFYNRYSWMVILFVLTKPWRTKVHDWQPQSQSQEYHGLPNWTCYPGNQDYFAVQSPATNPQSLGTTPPMPLPMVDTPSLGPPALFNHEQQPRGGGGGSSGGVGDDTYIWTSGSPVPGDSSPFRLLPCHNNDNIGTISPQELHSEHMCLPLQPTNTKDHEDMGVFQFSDSDGPVPSYYSHRAFSTTPSSISFPNRLKSVAPSIDIASPGRRRAHGSSSHSGGSRRNRPKAEQRTPTAANYVPGGGAVAGQMHDGRRVLPAGPSDISQCHREGQMLFPPPPASHILPSNKSMEGDDLGVLGLAGVSTTPRSSRSRGNKKTAQTSLVKPSSSSTSTNTTATTNHSRKKKTAGVPVRVPLPNQAPFLPQAPTSLTAPLLFPPGQNYPGFVPIGQTAVASTAQGNRHPLDLTLKKRIIVAERDAGLTYKAIKNKYTRWRDAESTYRGLDRTARLPVEHRERVASWSEEHVWNPPPPAFRLIPSPFPYVTSPKFRYIECVLRVMGYFFFLLLLITLLTILKCRFRVYAEEFKCFGIPRRVI